MAGSEFSVLDAKAPAGGAAAPPARAAGLGADLRALRKSRGLTLADLAVRLGRSVGYLSQVERGLSDISISDLGRVAGLLDVPISWFFAQGAAPEAERGHIVRGPARRRLGSAESGLTEELLSPDLGGSFEIIRSQFEPGAELAQDNHRRTEEAGYVVSGALELWISGRHFTLQAGDSFRFHDEPYRWRNPGPESCVVIWVIAPPVY